MMNDFSLDEIENVGSDLNFGVDQSIEVDKEFHVFQAPYWAKRKVETIQSKEGLLAPNDLMTDLFMLAYEKDEALKTTGQQPKGEQSEIKQEFIDHILNDQNTIQDRMKSQGHIGKSVAFATAYAEMFHDRNKHESQMGEFDYEYAAKKASDTIHKAGELVSIVMVPGGGSLGNEQREAELNLMAIKELIHGDYNNVARLRSIIDILGRLIPIANAIQREKAAMPYGEVHDIIPSGNLSKITSRERMNFAMGGMVKQEALVRLSENKLSTYQTKELTGMGKGDVVMYIDESGSMRKEARIENAKAIALVMTSTVIRQGRNIRIKSFSSIAPRSSEWSNRDGDTEEQLIQWACSMMGGDTHFVFPFIESYDLPEIMDGDSDLIVITDADRVPMLSKKSEIQRSFDLRKKRGCKTTIIHIGDRHDDVPLLKQYLGDVVYSVSGLNVDGEAVKEILMV